MACRACRSFLAFILKFLNFLQTFVGIAIILYSVWMLNHWNHNHNVPPPSAPSPESDPAGMLALYTSEVQKDGELVGNSQYIFSRKLGEHMSSGLDDNELQFSFKGLPAPWFIYSLMSIGVLLCLITCVGHIAGETINVVILLEAALVGFMLLDKHWEEDLPYDPTGEFQQLRSFIEDNVDICNGVGLSVVAIQALSLLLALILRAMVTRRGGHYESDEDDYLVRADYRQPLLGTQVTASTSMDSKSNRSDAWSTRMREKYGLNPNEFAYGGGDPNVAQPMRTGMEDQGRCSIL
ncbi:Tetraspanin-18 [Nymphaea thermarum]|nr:Tetraspanin-18 [Nymphaea thermarum]